MGGLAYILSAEPLEMNNWHDLDISFFNMIFAFCRSAASGVMLAVIRPLILGRGEEALNTAQFTGTVSFGFTVLGSADSDVRKEILLIRPLMSIWHWLNSVA